MSSPVRSPGSTAGCPAWTTSSAREITQTVRRVVDKLLHAPTVRVKQLAGEPGGAGYADALRELFDLDPQTVAAVSRADTATPTAHDEHRGAGHDRQPTRARCGWAPGAASSPWPSPGWSPSAVRELTGRPVELVEITTYGDISREQLAQIGGTGVFVSALRDALLQRRDRLRRALAEGPADRAARGPDAGRRCRGARTRGTCWSPATG